MSVVWPGALRWTSIASRPIRCSTAPKIDNLLSRILRTTTKSYSSPSCPSPCIRPLIIRSNHPICPSARQNVFTFPMRAIKTKKKTPSPVIRKYEDLPDNYEDTIGLSFRDQPLSQKEVTQWFGSGVDAATANIFLRILHGRRVAGTLEDPAYTSHHSIQARLGQDGLAWLRKNVPVDEIENAGLRAEAELAAMNEKLLADSQAIGIYRPNSQPAESQPESGLEYIRRVKDAEYQAKMVKKEEAQKQADEIRQVSGDLTIPDLKSRVELRRPGENPRLKYYQEKAANALPKMLPIMSISERLLPSALFALATVFGCILFAVTYVPPQHRIMFDVPPAAATVMILITINAFFLLAWRIPPLWVFMTKYMLVTPGYPRAVAIFGNMFSHQTLGHYASNMVILWVIGTRLGDQIGRGDFLAIYISAGVLGALLSLTYYVRRGLFVSSHLGASGAICGIIAAFCWINMDQKLDWVFLPEGWVSPAPQYTSLAFLMVVVFLEILNVRLARNSLEKPAVDSINHVGGYLTGIVGGEIIRRKMKAKQEQRGVLLRKKPLPSP